MNADPSAGPPASPAMDLAVELAGVRLPNPVLPASGTYEIDEPHDGFFPAGELGAVINKTIFREPRKGNPPPRIWETPSGMLNAIGIPSKGLAWFLTEELPRLSRLGPPVIASVAGEDLAEFAEVAGAVGSSGLADLLELDLSCPNLGDGIPWATNPERLAQVLQEVRRATRLPVIAKLSPNVRSVAEMAEVAEASGAAAVSLVNTYQGMAIDLRSRRPALGNLTGGLSGPAIRPLAVYAVYTCYERIRIPIIGMGGVAAWQDAVEFLLAGATAVAVGTQNFVNPLAMREVLQGLRGYLQRVGLASVRELIGQAHQA